MLVKLFGLSPLAVPNFHGMRGQRKTFAQQYCPGGGNINLLTFSSLFFKVPAYARVEGVGGLH